MYKSRKKIVTCKECGKEFIGSKTSLYCSKDCCRKQYITNRQYPLTSSGTTGAIQELRVAVDLMSKGYEVYRAVSPSSSCDLIALLEGEIYTIEVRTAYITKQGRLVYPARNIRAKNLVLVLSDRILYYWGYKHEDRIKIGRGILG